MPVTSMLISSMASSGGGQGGGGGLANMGGGLLSGVVGYFQRRKAKKELAKLSRPQYEIPQEILKNQKMAELSANEGLPSEQYNKAMQDINTTQNSLLAGATDRRSALMALPKLARQANESKMNLNVADAQARMQNQRTLYGVGAQTAQYRDKAFNVNRMQPYTEDKNYYMGLLGQGNQNLLSGADRFLAGGSQMLFGQNSGGSSGGKNKKGYGNNNDLQSSDGYAGESAYG